MSEHDTTPGNEHDLLIAEYALGVLSVQERAQVEAMLVQSAPDRALLAAWQSHFAGWLARLPAVEPPDGVWLAIQQELFPEEVSPNQRTTPGNNAGIWRWTTAIALAASLLLAVFILVRPAPLAPPSMIARLAQDDGAVLFTATVQSQGRQVLLVPTRKADWQDKSAQAWVIGGDGKPHSLGLLPTDNAIALSVPADLAALLASGAVLAVSLEPPTGSPTGLPTGPVIATGKITVL
jgi:anti-sigma-K factor RskA